MQIRCSWCEADPIYMAYHDTEWGVPEYDEQKLFEKLLLEGFQAGLSWITILRKRENFRQAFENFNPEKIADFDDSKINALLQDSGIIRNQLKIRAAVHNAQAYLRLKDELGSFSDFLWAFVGNKTQHNAFSSLAQIPTKNQASERMSLALKQRGFKFVGPTICYAFMQAMGMVNDHLVECFRYAQLKQE